MGTLAAAGLDPISQSSLIHALNEDDKRDAQVVELLQGIRMPGLMQLEAIGDAAKVLQRLKGPAAAAAWVRSAVPPNLLAPLSDFAYARDLDDLLWSVIPRTQVGSPDDSTS